VWLMVGRMGNSGAYSQSCEDCALDGTKLTCRCKTPRGEPGVKATVDLSMFSFFFHTQFDSKGKITDAGQMLSSRTTMAVSGASTTMASEPE